MFKSYHITDEELHNLISFIFEILESASKKITIDYSKGSLKLKYSDNPALILFTFIKNKGQ